MSWFDEAMAMVPRAAKVTAAAVYVIFLGLLLVVLQVGNEPLRTGERALIGVLAAFALLLLAAYILLIGYVYADARRRGMRHVLWTLLAIFVPNGIGILLYFVLRDPLPAHCPRCAAAIRKGFAYCPRCGTAVHAVCARCGRGVEPGWAVCAFCGNPLAGDELSGG